MSFMILYNEKNAFLGYKNKNSKNWENLHFSKGVNPWFWSKNGRFFKFFFLGNKGQDNVFYDIVERKNAFSRLSKQEVQKIEKFTLFFPKGSTHGFGPKMAIFVPFFYAILARKMSFLIF